MKIVDLGEAVRDTSDINKKFEYVITSLSTATTANTNALLLLIDALKASPGFNVAELKKSLESLKAEPPVNADINGAMHSQIMGIFLSRLS